MGLIEGEGSFGVYYKETKYTKKNNEVKIHKSLQVNFSLGMSLRDKEMVSSIKEFLGFGRIYLSEKRKTIYYRISSKKDAKKIIQFIDGCGGFLGFKNKQYIEWKNKINNL